MFWQEEQDEERGYRAPQDVFDLLFRLHGNSMRIDHAHALANSLRDSIDPETCARIGVHGIRMAASGNGWMRPDEADAEMPLSRRARLVIRVHERDRDEVLRIADSRMELDGHAIEIGEAQTRELSTLDTLFSRAIAADPGQSETDFLVAIAEDLQAMGITVSKMLCGRSGKIRTDDGEVFTRALMIAGLRPRESVELQRRGVGENRLLGCGLFIPHKGIDAVFDMQEDA
jgi:CRISPR-associated protein Cas6